jgi:hypothetical protein
MKIQGIEGMSTDQLRFEISTGREAGLLPILRFDCGDDLPPVI